MTSNEDLGDAGALVLPAAELTLLILPDPEVQGGAAAALFGRLPAQRLCDDARACGFTRLAIAPGVRGSIAGAEELATGDPIGGAALVAYESACVHRDILRLMVEHPLDPDERFTLYDAAGRPCAWFTGDLPAVLAAMPISEEIAWPEEVGPADLVRLIYAEDRARGEAIVRRSDRAFPPDDSLWARHVEAPLLRRLAGRGRPLAQVEALALVLGIGSGALVLVLGGALGATLGALALVVGVEIARLLPALRRLGLGGAPTLVDDVLHRPFAHAAFTAALTYALVADAARSSAADLVLLVLGGAAVLAALGHARALLRRQRRVPLDLPGVGGLAAGLGFRWPARLRVPLAIEALALLLAPLGAGPAWVVMVAAGHARLWRWFITPDERSVRGEADRSR